MQSGYTLETGEEIIQTVRRHWINFLPVLVSAGVSLGLVVFLSYAEGRYRDTITKYIPNSVIAIVIVILVILALLVFFLGLWVYRQNCLILTNKHLIQI